ncbi:MAG: tetratricopeptide repeat protein [Hyphomicrobiaceae bacterium]
MSDHHSDEYNGNQHKASSEMTSEPSEHTAESGQSHATSPMPEEPDLIARIANRAVPQGGSDASSDLGALDSMRDSLKALKAQASGNDPISRPAVPAPATDYTDDYDPSIDMALFAAEDSADAFPVQDALSVPEAAPAQEAAPVHEALPEQEIAPEQEFVPAEETLPTEEPWTDASAEQLTAHCEEAGFATDSDAIDGSAGREGAASESAMNYVYLEPGLEHRGQHWLENRLDEISRRLDAVGNSPELAPLLERFDALESRIDTALVHSADGTNGIGGDPTGGSLHDIELCIAEIATQLEATNSELTRFDGVEAQITEIAQAIAAQRDAAPTPTVDPAAMFDMAALADLVADKVATKPLAAMAGSGDAPADAAGISELSTVMKDFIRERRSEGEHANAVLDTMQQTIIRVLDRMEALEAGGPRGNGVATHTHAPSQPAHEQPQPAPAPAATAAAAPANKPDAATRADHATNEPAEAKPSTRTATQSDDIDAASNNEDAASLDRLQQVMGQLGEKQSRAQSGGQSTGKAKSRPQPDADAAPAGTARSSRSDFIKAARQAATKANQPAELQADEAIDPDRAKFANAARQAAAKANQRMTNDDVLEDEIDATDDGFSSESIAARLPLTGKTNNRARLLVAAVAIVAVGLVATKFMMSLSSDAARKELQATGTKQSSQIGGKAEAKQSRTVASVAKPAAAQLGAGRLAQTALARPHSQSVSPGSVSYGSIQAQPAAVGPHGTVSNAGQPISGGAGSVSRKALPPAMIGPLSLRLAAANGEASAEFQVAARFADGKGVKQDFDAAIKWYTRAAGRGFALAQYRLGTFYERGLGVDKDFHRAQVWYQRAASNDNIKAMHNLAVLAAGSSIGKPDYATAAQWFTKAAERGLADSQFNLAILYQNGLGVPQDDTRAYKWFKLAAAGGDQEAVRRVAELAGQIGKAQVKRTEDELRKWMRKPSSKLANDPHFAGQAWQRKNS